MFASYKKRLVFCNMQKTLRYLASDLHKIIQSQQVPTSDVKTDFVFLFGIGLGTKHQGLDGETCASHPGTGAFLNSFIVFQISTDASLHPDSWSLILIDSSCCRSCVLWSTFMLVEQAPQNFFSLLKVWEMRNDINYKVNMELSHSQRKKTSSKKWIQVFAATWHLQVAHRDLKPANILLSSDCKLKAWDLEESWAMTKEIVEFPLLLHFDG